MMDIDNQVKLKNKSVNDVIKNYKKYFPYPFPGIRKKRIYNINIYINF